MFPKEYYRKAYEVGLQHADSSSMEECCLILNGFSSEPSAYLSRIFKNAAIKFHTGYDIDVLLNYEVMFSRLRFDPFVLE